MWSIVDYGTMCSNESHFIPRQPGTNKEAEVSSMINSPMQHGPEVPLSATIEHSPSNFLDPNLINTAGIDLQHMEYLLEISSTSIP